MAAPNPDDAFARDIAAIGRIEAVPTILDVVCRATGMGFAAIARVTEDRWIACAVKDDIGFGLKPGGELEVETTICHEIRQSGEGVVIDHVSDDGRWSSHPTPARYGFQSYISLPIVRADGSFFGTLCAIDAKPAVLETPRTLGMFKLFADLIAFHLDAVDRLAASEARLSGERGEAVLREQFIAVLGHDLRNPLASIKAGAELLLGREPDAATADVLRLMESSVDRMAALIDNVVDFARGRLGGGLETRRAAVALEPVLRLVLDELRSTAPDRRIDADFAIDAAVFCDAGRIGQLFSNLLANALTHGAADTPVRLAARTAGGVFELSVANAGEPIPAAVLERLFQPFFRGGAQPSRPTRQDGLGLGLYIAHEIARAHGGTLTATSTVGETRFTLRMPIDRRA